MLDNNDFGESVDLLSQAIEKGRHFWKMLVNLPVVPISGGGEKLASRDGKSGKEHAHDGISGK